MGEHIDDNAEEEELIIRLGKGMLSLKELTDLFKSIDPEYRNKQPPTDAPEDDC